MMRFSFFSIPSGVVLCVSLLFVGCGEEGERERRERVAAVAAAPIEKRSISLRRSFSGALEAKEKMVVAPKVSGRLERLTVDLADTVDRGQPVALLEDSEFAQAVKQAEAEVAVAEANSKEAKNALEISKRETQRIVTLNERGISSAAEYDTAQIELLGSESKVAVAEAQLSRAEAALEESRIRYGYTRIAADWIGGDSKRVVAERFVEEGETVSANEPLLLIVELDPISAVINVTERDYGLLSSGQEAIITTDSFPGRTFTGRIERIAPVFRENTRQARVELSLENPGGRLKPGMFVRALITLDHVENATVVPESALTTRAEKTGVFVINEAGGAVRWQPISVGIRSDGFAQIREEITGRVVTLGQHLIDDGSAITIPEMPSPEAAL